MGHPIILNRLENLEWITRGISERFDQVEIYYDLSELRGYNYHTGIVFAAYVGPPGQAVAMGGRYDHIGEVFGRRRGATGFDVHLKGLPGKVRQLVEKKQVVVAAESVEATAKARWRKIQALRQEGFIVIESGVSAENFDFELVDDAGEWQLRPSANTKNG